MHICFTLSQGTGCFNGFLASMLLAYLLTTHRISNTMTAYQMLRNSLNFLCKEEQNGKCLCFYDFKLIFLYLVLFLNLFYLPFCFTASTDLTVNGISLAKDPDSTAVSAETSWGLYTVCYRSIIKWLCPVSAFLHMLQPSQPEFHDAFQVVFVDPSGHLNMCADMTACTYKQVNLTDIQN